MSSVAKKRSALKTGDSNRDGSAERDATPVPNELSQDGDIGVNQSSIEMTEGGMYEADGEDHASFSDYMMKPSNLRDIWSIFKVKKSMTDFLTWYFRPKNSYDPERVDYNALNILAEYQTYNMEFLRNELDLTYD